MKDNIKDHIVNRFYKKRIIYTDENGEQKEKTVSKSSAKDIADSIFMLDPTDTKKYVNALGRTHLKENSDIYNWLISSYYVNSKDAKMKLKEFHKALRKYDENRDLFDQYDKNFHNFNTITDFIYKVDEVVDLKFTEDEEKEQENQRNKKRKQTKSKLNILKNSKVEGDLLVVGSVDIVSNNFLNIFELNEIKKFSNKEVDYHDYFEEHEVNISPELLNGYVNHITKDDTSFYKFTFDIVKSNGGVYSIIDIEEELNNQSINSISSFEEFTEMISVEAIFQYLSEFLPDIYEFFEVSIIAGNHRELINKIEFLFGEINSNGMYEDDVLDCKFLIKVPKPFTYKVCQTPKYAKHLMEKDMNGEISPELISLDGVEDSSLEMYVAHNRIINEFDSDINDIIKDLGKFNEGEITDINYEEAVNHVKENIPTLREKFVKT